jgi:hypothetical protein
MRMTINFEARQIIIRQTQTGQSLYKLPGNRMHHLTME